MEPLGKIRHSDVDQLLASISAAKQMRELELHEAFRHPDMLMSQITKDAANLIAGIGGYAAPVEQVDREEWIKRQMMTDAHFFARVNATVNLIHEYVRFSSRHRG